MTKLTPMKAIRAKCLDCCCWQPREVRLCTAEKCPLYPYRMGRRPKNDELLNEENSIEKTLDSAQFFTKERY